MPFINKAVFSFLMVAQLGAADMLHREAEGGSTRRLRGSSHEAMAQRSLWTSYDDVSIYEGNWGDWGGEYVSGGDDMFACGAAIRLESKQDKGDDTAANGLKLKFCNVDDWDSQSTKTIHEGLWGDWTEMVTCPPNKYISGAQVRFEDKQGAGDDTALNGLKIWCADASGNDGEWMTVSEGYWGEWKNQVKEPAMFVTGANVRFENSQENGDDTAWNGLSFRMLPPHYPREYFDFSVHNGEWGEWKGWEGADKAEMYACGAQIRFEEKQGDGDDTAANGLKLKFCHIDDWDMQDTKSIYDGIWGEWGEMIMCPKDKWIAGAKVRFEDHVRDTSFDDTALNGLQIWCQPVDHRSTVSEGWVTVEEGIWGNWTGGITQDERFVKWANVKFEDSQGRGDDTAWNGLKFRMGTPTPYLGTIHIGTPNGN